MFTYAAKRREDETQFVIECTAMTDTVLSFFVCLFGFAYDNHV